MPAKQLNFTKTRIAPTSSGYLHVGNILSFAITAALARKHQAKILLRIDDLDQARVSKAYLQDIFDTLNFLELPWEEGAKNVEDFESNYSQLTRMDIYRQALQQLADEQLVFACNCSRQQINKCNCYDKQLPLSAENVNWRLITDNSDVDIKSYNGEVIRTSLPAEMHNFIVRKKDGFPAYQLTSIIDDLHFGIDLIVRGQDLWPSTIAQHVLARSLGKVQFSAIAFYHHPLIVETSGKKLSKSDGATSIKHLREIGKSSTDTYRLIGEMLGIKEATFNWQALGEAMLK